MPDLPVPRERAQAGDHRPLHLGEVVAEADGIDQLAGPFVVLGIEGVDMADAAAHEQEDDRLGLGLEVRPEDERSGISRASAQIAPRATPKNPPPAWWRKPRREIRPQG